ncbi:MAG: leucine-rich repeat domain-containing protein [Chitinivibrionales bacterium]|nr:leucine-rich repeat domain-containing protein [Chitinivibrionales bacterium]
MKFTNVIYFVGLMALSACAQRYSDDSLIVRALLDSAGYARISVDSATRVDSGRIVSLDLSTRRANYPGFSQVDSRINRLSALQYLSLAGNDLEYLPNELCDLARLKRLDVRNNRLKELPHAIDKLAALEELNARNNQLETLPDEFYNLKSLRIVQLMANKIGSFPDKIKYLTNLRELYVRSNNLASLPRELLHMNLAKIDYDQNKICKPTPELERWMHDRDQDWCNRQSCPSGCK